MDKIKIGVFGAGRGMTMIHQTINNLFAELVAICDKYQPLLDDCKKLAEEKGVTVALYDDFEKFIEHDMDAVVLANYACEHAPYAIRLLKSGRHVMSEVLTCATMSQAVELIETVEQTGKLYVYAENYCYFNTTTEMRRRYKNGDIGEVNYAEGEYIHDCASIWPQITYGEREHWRNYSPSTFYCTHSLGPIIHTTGLRPISVVGLQPQNTPWMRKLGALHGGPGIEMVTLENGAIVKSIHGALKREPGSVNYQIYGMKGSMETNRRAWGMLDVYLEGDKNCVGDNNEYCPDFPHVDMEICDAGHGGSDFFTVYYFIKAIMGDKNALENIIDVYEAVDMCICGILAFKSIVKGGITIKVPNLRNKEERDEYRNDNFCGFPHIAGDEFVPADFRDNLDRIDDEIYDNVRKKWENGEQG